MRVVEMWHSLAMDSRSRNAHVHRGPGAWGWLAALPPVLYAALADLWAPDEPRYAQVAREAWERGSFLTMHLNGEVYPDKPPLVFWLSALSGRLGGWSELAVRLPPLLATLATAWLVGRIARRLWGELEASWAPFFFFSTIYVLHFGGRLQLDPFLAFLCLGAIALLDALMMEPAPRRPRLAMWGAGACSGLAALVKGPVAWLHIALPLLVWHRWPRPVRRPAVPARSAWAWIGLSALWLLPVLTWAGLAARAEPSLARELFWDQHVGRVLRANQHRQPFWMYAVTFTPMLLPWIFVCGGALVRAARGFLAARAGGSVDVGLQKAASWLLSLLVLFSILPVKRNLYLVPAYPAAVLLCARYVAEMQREGRLSAWVRRLSAVGLALLGAVVLSGPFFPDHFEHLVGGRSMSEAIEALGWRPMLLGAVALVTAGLALYAPDARAFARRIGVGFTLVGVIYTTLCVPQINPFKSARVLANYLAQRPERPMAIPCFGLNPEGYRFYGGVPAVSSSDLGGALEREGPEFLALVEGGRWERLPPELRRRFAVLLDSDVGGRRVVVLGRGAS